MEKNKMTENINLFSLPMYNKDDAPYDCNIWVIYKDSAYKSLKPNNDRHPHDSEYWYEIGGVEWLLNHVLDDHKSVCLALPYYPECSNGCVAMFNKGQSVIDRIKLLSLDGTPIKNDCGEDVYQLQIFTSLIDCNTDSPLLGSNKTPPTWDGGYSTSEYLNEYLNKPVEVKPADNSITVDSDGVSVNISDGFELTDDGIKVKAADDSIEVTPEGVQLGIIGTDIAGQPIDVQKDPCLVTCENLKNEDFYVENGQLKVNFPLQYGTEPTLIYTDTNDPNTATVFDDENPPVANDDAFKQSSQYLYVGADGSQWTWNGTAYISSPQNTTVGVGSSAAITRIFPPSPSGTFLSASATGLFVFEGIRFDIKWQDSTRFLLSLVNTTASAVTLQTNNTSTAFTIEAGAVKTIYASPWDAPFVTGDEDILVNNKWYVLRTVAYPSGTARMVHMVLQRRV